MLYAIVGLLVIIADQWVKFWVANHISMSSVGEDFIPGILSLVNVHNDGAAFGFLSGSGARIPFIVLAGVFARDGASSWWLRAAFPTAWTA